MIPGHSPPLMSIETELNDYFAGKLKVFKTPYCVFGSPFQQQVWEKHCEIPYAQTRSYAEQSASLGKPKAYRAVANANGAKSIGDYCAMSSRYCKRWHIRRLRSGLTIKEWLINHEKRYKTE